MGTNGPDIQGEGDHASARRYDEAARRFVDEGRVGPAAERARSEDPATLAENERAEAAGRARMREEDPLLHGGPEAASDAREAVGGQASGARDREEQEPRSGGDAAERGGGGQGGRPGA